MVTVEELRLILWIWVPIRDIDRREEKRRDRREEMRYSSLSFTLCFCLSPLVSISGWEFISDARDRAREIER